jgi:cytochrome P450
MRTMSDTVEDGVPYLDLADPTFRITSQQVMDAREQSWYARTSYGLAVLRYEEAAELLKSPDLRSGSTNWLASNGVTEGPLAEWAETWLLHIDGDAHQRMRSRMRQAFLPKVLKAFTPRFQALATELVDAFVESGRCEFMADFASPYAARAFAIIFGMPEEDWSQLVTWSTTLGLSMGVNVARDLPQIDQAVRDLFAYTESFVAERSRAGADGPDDFVSALIRGEGDDEPLRGQELLETVASFVFAGFDTTRNQLGLAMASFLAAPDQWALLGDRPELAGTAVEEVMRVNPTTRWVTRLAIRDIEVNGLAIEEGTVIHLLTQAAGTDPTMVARSTAMDISDKRPAQLGFGGGPHHCIGARLARLDMTEALAELAPRLRSVAPEPGAEWLPDSGNTGPRRLPMSFTPGPRTGGR